MHILTYKAWVYILFTAWMYITVVALVINLPLYRYRYSKHTQLATNIPLEYTQLPAQNTPGPGPGPEYSLLDIDPKIRSIIANRGKRQPSDVSSIGNNTESFLYQRDVEDAYFQFISLPQANCSRTKRAGVRGDGGWTICMGGPYSIWKDGRCIVYSVGIANSWSFDDYMAQNRKCTVYAYDPSMVNTQDHIRKEKIHFFRTGLHYEDAIIRSPRRGRKRPLHLPMWRMRTFKSLLNETGHTHDIVDVLKFDCEGCEKKALPAMVADGSLRNVKQIVFEFHNHKPTLYKAANLLHDMGILLQLEAEGFLMWNYICNRSPKSLMHSKFTGVRRCFCSELSYINTKFMKP